MTSSEEAHFITLWNTGTETAAIAQALGTTDVSTHLRKYAIMD